ncbi:MAG: hypothetical protein EXR72_04250 [Myxococcales bacterium]|nr:hypothetical protein [Myxococcales bacterium]
MTPCLWKKRPARAGLSWSARPIAARLSPLLLPLCVLGCGGTPPMAAGPIAIFAPPATGSPDLASVPWPSDLFLDGGRVKLSSLTPLQTTAMSPVLLDDLARHDGFAVTAGAFFPVSEAIDPATLDGRVKLVDLEGGAEIPLTVVWRGDDKLVHARPQNGRVLIEKHRYAYLLTDGIKNPGGAALSASPDWKSVRDANPRPSDARLGHAWDVAKPLLDLYGFDNPKRGQITAAAVFTTETITADLQAVRAHVHSLPAPAAKVAWIFADTKLAGDDATLDELCGAPKSLRAGEDNPGGIAHDGIGWVIQGSFEAPDFLAATAPTADAKAATTSLAGRMTFEGGKAKALGTATVPFTLVLPKTPAGGTFAKLPAVIFQHGLGGSRATAVAVANGIAREGYAVIAMDLPFHGMRHSAPPDQIHNFTMAAGPDGFAERGGDANVAFFNVLGDPKRNLAQLDPSVIRGAFQQSVSDLMTEVRLITEGSFAAASARDARLAGLSLHPDKVMYSGESFGSIVGGIAIAHEPKIGAAVLSVGGGGLIMPLVSFSVGYSPIFTPLLDGGLGTNVSAEPVESDPGYNLIQFLLEGGDPLAHAPYVIQHPLPGAQPRHVVLLEAHLDEAVPNIATEALAFGMGLEAARVAASGTPSYDYLLPKPTVREAPFMGNLVVAGRPVTAALVQFETASHGMFTHQKGQRTREATKRPFVPLPKIVELDNPIDALQSIYAQFAKDYFSGFVPTVK